MQFRANLHQPAASGADVGGRCLTLLRREEGKVTIARAITSLTYPPSFMLGQP